MKKYYCDKCQKEVQIEDTHFDTPISYTINDVEKTSLVKQEDVIYGSDSTEKTASAIKLEYEFETTCPTHGRKMREII